ncbi:MAG: SDR family oxidoreductase [Sebaldella sp.]|nr:SDR family oxidoreductase [Sebaldella sp.]
METVLITGASSGLGYEFAKLFAEKGYDLVISARREERLNSFKKSYPNISIEIIPCDLSLDGGAEYLYNKVMEKNITVNILINNAGFGLFGEFKETDLKKEEEMINLNIKALTGLTKLFLKDMLEKDHGKILNVASIAAFQPGPYMSIYYASKAFVLSFTEALRNELRNTKVKVSVLCPGPVKTEFEKSANLENSKLFSIIKPITPEKVVTIAYKGMEKNKAIIIPGLSNKFIIFMSRFASRNLIVNMARKIQEKKQ